MSTGIFRAVVEGGDIRHLELTEAELAALTGAAPATPPTLPADRLSEIEAELARLRSRG